MYKLKFTTQLVVLLGVFVQLVLHFYYQNQFITFRPIIWSLQTIAIIITLIIIVKERKKSLEQINRLRTIERKVHKLSVAVKITTTANWKDGQPPKSGHSIGAGAIEVPFATFIHRTADVTKEIKCCADTHSYHRDDDNQTIFINNFKASVRSGGWPLGQTVDELMGYDRLILKIPSVLPNMIDGVVVTVKEWIVKVYVNGEYKMSLERNIDIAVDLPPITEGWKLVLEQCIENMLRDATS